MRGTRGNPLIDVLAVVVLSRVHGSRLAQKRTPRTLCHLSLDAALSFSLFLWPFSGFLASDFCQHSAGDQKRQPVGPEPVLPRCDEHANREKWETREIREIDREGGIEKVMAAEGDGRIESPARLSAKLSPENSLECNRPSYGYILYLRDVLHSPSFRSRSLSRSWFRACPFWAGSLAVLWVVQVWP